VRETNRVNASPFASGGSCSRGSFLAPTGRFAAGAGRRVTDRRARGASIHSADLNLWNLINLWMIVVVT
jgi:hypothetical protein